MWNFKRKKKKGPKSERTLIKEQLHEIVKLIVRERDKHHCVKCGREVFGSQAHTSHYFNRFKLTVAWDLRNVDLLCFGCHRKIENKKTEMVDGWCYEAFKRAQLGDKVFTQLEVLSGQKGLYSVLQLEEKYTELSKVLLKYGVEPPPIKKPKVKKALAVNSELPFSKAKQVRKHG